MPELETPTECILTLAEAAAFLRVTDKALAEKAAAGEVPARQIGGEWRFLRQALVDWLYAGAKVSPNGAPRRPLPGSKKAVFRHFGILRNHDDLEKILADLAAQRAAWPDGGRFMGGLRPTRMAGKIIGG
jgi:excisionase family DNA binding protein